MNPGTAAAGLSGLTNVDEILANVQDLEAAIQQLSQALQDEVLGSVNGSGSDEDLSLNADQLKMMINNGKIMLRRAFQGQSGGRV